MFGEVSRYRSPSSKELFHRGPEHFGLIESEGSLISHYRLSIVDLSPNGNQPLVSKKSCLVFNGEIYNYKDLLHQYLPELSGSIQSDSVALHALLDRVGSKIISELNGMYAVVYKTDSEVLFFRDRAGIKPLYYCQHFDSLLISSEIGPLKTRLNPKIKKEGLAEYIVHGAVLTDTIYEGILDAEPGHLYSWSFLERNILYERIEYKSNINEGDLDKVLDDVVESMEANEVPSALLLSGGIDSSLLAHYLSKLPNRPKAITVDFGRQTINNEVYLAKIVAKKLGLEHQVIHVDSNKVKLSLEGVLQNHGQPFADAADIVLDSIYKSIKNEFKVVFQGDGGDEMFGGYNRHRFIKFSKILKILPQNLFVRNRKIYRILSALNKSKFFETHSDLMREDSLIYEDLKHLFNPKVDWYSAKYKHYKRVHDKLKMESDLDALFAADKKIWLPKVFLKKVDIPSMKNSLEVRVPYLHDIIQNWSDKLSKKTMLNFRHAKLTLRRLAERNLPREIYTAKKMGFGVPYKQWLIEDFKEEYLDILDELSSYDILDIKLVRDNFINNTNDYLHFHWKLFVLCKWLKSI